MELADTINADERRVAGTTDPPDGDLARRGQAVAVRRGLLAKGSGANRLQEAGDHMTIEQLRKAARTAPFKPFMISLTHGRRFHVRQPEMVAVLPEATRTFVVAGTGEDYSIVDLSLVTSIDFEGRKAPGGKNGKRNGRSRGAQ